MYEAHFGLKNRLFTDGIAKEEAVFVGPRQQLVVANFKVALTTLDAAILLTGAAGVGKTTLTAAALRTTSTRLAFGWIGSLPSNGSELLELLLAEFGFNAHRVGRIERLQMWRQFLNETNTTDSRVFVIAERADEMHPEVLQTLASVTASDPDGCLGANLVLLGSPELHDRLKSSSFASLNQRVRLRQRLEPLSAEELEAYLKHRVALAGGSYDRVFERDTAATLHRYSGGIFKLVNNLCDTALTLAASAAEEHVTPQIVAGVAIGLYGIDPAEVAARPTSVSADVDFGEVTQVDESSTGTTSVELPILTDALEAPPEGELKIVAANGVGLAARQPDGDFDLLNAALALAGWSSTADPDADLLDDVARAADEPKTKGSKSRKKRAAAHARG